MPTCDNCGSWISEDYARVNGVDGVVEACPHCDDRKRDASAPRGWRPTVLSRHAQTGPEPSKSPEETA